MPLAHPQPATAPTIGIGDQPARLIVYAPHRPPLAGYQQLNHLRPCQAGELAALVEATGNHWRKILNLYAKLLHRLEPFEARWQDCRDQRLLQPGSATALMFSSPLWPQPNAWHLVMGKTYAADCALEALPDLREYGAFRWSPTQRLILTPYFDYRALSNATLDELYRLIDSQGGLAAKV